MQEQIIKYETAVIAKEKGFDWKVSAFIENTGPMSGNILHNDMVKENYNDFDFKFHEDSCVCSAPTQSLLQKWIRDVHNIYTTVISSYVNNELVKDAFLFENPHLKKVNQCKNYYPTYEEALEAGLIEALKMINV